MSIMDQTQPTAKQERRPAFAFTPDEWRTLARSGDVFERRVEASKRGAGHASDPAEIQPSGECAGAAIRSDQ